MKLLFCTKYVEHFDLNWDENQHPIDKLKETLENFAQISHLRSMSHLRGNSDCEYQF